MTAPRAVPGRYRIRALGSDLRLDLAGPDQAACLAAAVRGFAAAVAGDAVPAEATRDHQPVDFAEESPEALLVRLVDDLVLRLDVEGLLGAGLDVGEADGGVLQGRLALVPISALTLQGVTPKAATWHDVRLGPAGQGWEGSIVLDL